MAFKPSLKSIPLIIFSAAAIGIPQARGAANQPEISVFQTIAHHDGIQGFEPQAPEKFQNFVKTAAADDVPTFVLNPLKRYQAMDGFGATLTESCAINLNKLSATLRHEALEKIFSKTSGAGFDILRLPMGATDFSDAKAGSYTYDDTAANESDPLFKHFNMARDEKSLAIIREAKLINPHLQVMISPWSPPAWMKTGRQLKGGSLDPNHYQDFANYFVRVIHEYQERAIPVKMLTIQNEPGYSTSDYPTMGMTPIEQSKFISQYLGPTLAQQHVNVRVFAHDHNWDQSADVNAILASPATQKYVDGVAYHCYGGNRWQMYDSMNLHPTTPTLQDECSGIAWIDQPNDFAWWLDNQSVGAVNMGTTGALGWNLCLDEQGGPTNGGCAGCRGMVTTDFSKAKPELRFNPEFYALGQVSRFIVPGARRLDVQAIGVKSGDDALEATAFVNPKGDFVFVVENPSTKAAPFRLRQNAQAVTYSLPPNSAVTMTWK